MDFGTVIEIVRFTGHAAGLVAIGCLLYAIAADLQDVWRYIGDDHTQMRNLETWYWSGVLFFAVFMACQVGVIGL